jgi:hypothetical protein
MHMKRKKIQGYILQGLMGGMLALIPIVPSLASPSTSNHELELLPTSTIEQVRADAQALASQSLDAAFRANPNQNTVTIAIAVSFNGESLPFLSITLDRATWSQKPDLAAHTKYLATSIKFLHRSRPTSAPFPVSSSSAITGTNLIVLPSPTTTAAPNRYPNVPPPDRAKVEADLKQLQAQERGY